jgi:primosomal protein N' (replication factor Y)
MAHGELNERKAFGYPPYSRLIRLLLRHDTYDVLHRAAHHMAQLLRQKFGSRVMGPVSPALEMLRGEHRAEIAVKIECGGSMKRARTMLRDVVDRCHAESCFKGIKIDIDVDAW